MICPHCREVVESFNVCQSVVHVQRVLLREEEPFVDNAVVLEYPRGKSRYRFRCGQCGGDLSDRQRECLNLFRRGTK